jgi:CubicO group peptidase (beta-lactamase class C family)
LAADAPPRTVDGDDDHSWRLASLAGAGGLRSTVDDLLAFLQAQWAPPEPLRAAVDLALTKRHDGEAGVGMGLGWHIAKDGFTRWHTGGTGGYRSMVLVAREQRRAVVVLANTTSDVVDGIGEGVFRRLFGLPAEPPQVEAAAAVPAEQLARLCGRYRMPDGVIVQVAADARGLTAQLTGQPALRVYPRSATELFYRAVAASLVFELAGDASVPAAVTLHQSGRRIRCERQADAGK